MINFILKVRIGFIGEVISELDFKEWVVFFHHPSRGFKSQIYHNVKWATLKGVTFLSLKMIEHELNRAYRMQWWGVEHLCRSWQIYLSSPSSIFPEMVTKFWVGGGALVAKSCLSLLTPWTIAATAPLTLEFSWQDYWTGLPYPTPWDLFPTQDRTLISSISCWADSYHSRPTWEALRDRWKVWTEFQLTKLSNIMFEF